LIAKAYPGFLAWNKRGVSSFFEPRFRALVVVGLIWLGTINGLICNKEQRCLSSLLDSKMPLA